jgi:GNAT superfamily N-acetyltransferase
MNDSITIRQATAGDLSTLLEFEQGIIATERPFDATLKKGKISYYYLEGMLEDPQVRVVVALSGNEIVGSGYAMIRPAKPYLQHSAYAYLGFMYVLPAYRGRGINGKIIEDLRQWAALQGISEVRLEVYARNETAIRAYEKMGFAGHMLEMRLE